MPLVLISRFTGEISQSQSTGSVNDEDDDVDTTEIEVMISDLTDSDGMGWIDSDGNVLKTRRIDHLWQSGCYEAGFVWYGYCYGEHIGCCRLCPP